MMLVHAKHLYRFQSYIQSPGRNLHKINHVKGEITSTNKYVLLFYIKAKMAVLKAESNFLSNDASLETAID